MRQTSIIVIAARRAVEQARGHRGIASSATRVPEESLTRSRSRRATTIVVALRSDNVVDTAAALDGFVHDLREIRIRSGRCTHFERGAAPVRRPVTRRTGTRLTHL
jgi:hypothetical protein